LARRSGVSCGGWGGWGGRGGGGAGRGGAPPAPELVERRHRALRKAARRITARAPADDYHRLRIAGKRFRYALEFVADVYPGATERLVKRMAGLQDVLGAHQDADVAVARLRALAAERSAELGPATVFAMGEVAERYGQSMPGLRSDARRQFAAVEGKEWNRLREVLEAARPVDE
jgi:CHAD domain-containing protein